MLAYEDLKSALGREIWYRAPRYEARKLFPHPPPKLKVGRNAYQIQNISLGGVAAITKQSPEDALQVGETIELAIQQSGLPIFESHAKVCRAEKTMFGSKIAFNFVDQFIEFDKLISRNAQARIAMRPSLVGPDPNGLVSREYRIFCADILKLLRGYRAVLDADFVIPPEFQQGFDHESLFETCEARFVQEWRSLWHTGNHLVRMVMTDREKCEAVKEFTELVITPELRGGAIWDRAYTKPLGYPGDFESMKQVYDWKRVGNNAYEMLLHRIGLDTADCVKSRMEVVRAKIGETVADNRGDRPARILSLGCGPAREIEAYLAEKQGTAERAEFTLIDQEQRALDHAYRRTYPHIVGTEGRFKLQCLQMSFVDVLRGTGALGSLPPQELIYSVGLFDYLADRRATSLLRKLYNQLAPGGLLVIGNMNESSFSTLWPMEFITDWPLYYRTEGQMIGWTAGLAPAAAWTEIERTGHVRLLYVRKP